jgi:hypothetical protein
MQVGGLEDDWRITTPTLTLATAALMKGYVLIADRFGWNITLMAIMYLSSKVTYRSKKDMWRIKHGVQLAVG